jgi:hypothetical protein
MMAVHLALVARRLRLRRAQALTKVRPVRSPSSRSAELTVPWSLWLLSSSFDPFRDPWTSPSPRRPRIFLAPALVSLTLSSLSPLV